MKKVTRRNYIAFGLWMALCPAMSFAQLMSVNGVNAVPKTDRTVPFDVCAQGVKTPIEWGLDLAWLSEGNVRRGVNFMGKENVKIVRTSFQASYALVNGDLTADQKKDLQDRINYLKWVNPDTPLMLNSDPKETEENDLKNWYLGHPERWEQLIDVTLKYYQETGHPVVSVAPFNEPDYGWGQGTMDDFKEIAKRLKQNSHFDGIRISGGNTLNDDCALEWYNYLKDYLDEGNTHQLAGDFDHYADFFKAVRADGRHATADELHGLMEAMVGVEYGMQTGIWWGTAEWARGQFVKATNGERLGYAEHRPNWTAAAVYRHPDGKVQAFGGTSERQAVTTTYRFLSTNRDVFFDGYGPTREYVMTLPGGTGYQKGQTGAEGVVNVTWGEDVQPIVNGRYAIVNRKSGLVLEVTNGSTTLGTALRQIAYKKKTHQQWDVTPAPLGVGGGFCYYTFAPVSQPDVTPDVKNFSLEDKGTIMTYSHDEGKWSENQQWFLEYAGDGCFYIRNRHSSLYMRPVSGSKSTVSVVQSVKVDNDDLSLQWRFVPIDATIEFVAPSAPQGLTAQPQVASVKLNWNANTEKDVTGYNVYRTVDGSDEWNVIARNVETTSFTDNSAADGTTYLYKVKAVDKCLNLSEASQPVTAGVSGAQGLVAFYSMENDLHDAANQGNEASLNGAATYRDEEVSLTALSMNGIDNFIQLPTNVANHHSMTISAWFKCQNITPTWQRIFDFGRGEDAYLFLTPYADSKKIRFAIKNGGEEQHLDAEASMKFNKWTHVAVTLGDEGVRIYVDGKLSSSTTDITLRPDDVCGFLNYLGRSQFEADKLFRGYLDEVRLYNYSLSEQEVSELYQNTLTGIDAPADEVQKAELYVYDANGVMVKQVSQCATTYVPSAQEMQLHPAVYVLKWQQGNKVVRTCKVALK